MAKYKTGANRNIYSGQTTGKNVIPGSPVAFALRNTSDSLDGKTELIKSGELLPGRSASEPMAGQPSNGGGIAMEFSALSFDRLLSGVMMNNWVQDESDAHISTLTPGNISKAFWILKHFSEADRPLFQLFEGAQLDSLELTFAINAIVTGNFSFMGINDPLMETANPVAGLSSLPASLTTSPFTSRRGFLKLGSGATGVPITYSKEVKLSIKNNLAAVGALFQDTASIVEKMFDVGGSITTYLTDETLFNSAVNKDNLAFAIQVEDAAGNSYLFELSNTKLDTHSAAASGRDELSPTYPFTAFGTDTIKITRTLATARPVYTLTFDGNSETGGTEPAAVPTLEAGSVIYAPANTGALVQTGSVFTGWNSAADGTGVHFDVGDPILVEGATTIYAEWE